MPPQLVTTPTSVPLGGNHSTQPLSMNAVLTKRPCEVTFKLSDGTVGTRMLQAGAPGYLVQQQGNESLVQLYNNQSVRALAKIPTDNLDIGKPTSQFRVLVPSQQAAQAAVPIANRRGQDPAGKAITMLWGSIRENLDVLKQLGLSTNICEKILEDDGEMRKAVDMIIASFTDKAWRALNTPGLPVQALLGVPQITSTSPRLRPDQTSVYLRLYIKDPKSPQQQFAKYGGRTSLEFPFQRQVQHKSAINGSNVLTHYTEARKYPRANDVAIPMMLLPDAFPELAPMAEMTVCCLLRTWNPSAVGLSQQAIAEGLQSATMDHQLLMSLFSSITDTAFHRVNFPLFGGRGCNWSCPLQENIRGRREWLRYRVVTQDQREMLVYRWRVKIRNLSNGTVDRPRIGIHVDFGPPKGGQQGTIPGFVVVQNLAGLPGIKHGQPGIISIEVMEDGKPHPQPWYRAPYHGAWSNSNELHSFGIKVEWADEATKKWYTFPLSHAHVVSQVKIQGTDATVTKPWRKATMILQFLHNRRYRSTPPYLIQKFQSDIKEVVYDHLAQTVSFKRVNETVLDPPQKVSFAFNVRELTKASQTVWKEIIVGPMPEPIWLGSHVGKNIACTLCRAYRRVRQWATEGCAKREGNFNIDPNEPDQDRIRKWSCCLCWEYYRRPCVWTPSQLGKPEGETWNPHHPTLPPQLNGLCLAPPYEPVGTPIPPPMSIEQYFESKEQVEAIDGEELDLVAEEDED